MDAFSGVLSGPRASGAFLLRSELTAPWSMRIQDEAPLTVAAVVRGAAWVVPAVGAPIQLGTGAVALFRGPDHYTVADDPRTRPQVIIQPGQVCTTPEGAPVSLSMLAGPRTWGNQADGETVLVTGTYESVGEVSRRLLEQLPPVLSLAAAEWDSPLIALLAQEIRRDQPGQEAVLDRLLDLLTISALRTWLARDPSAPAWYHAHQDSVVGTALRALHADPARGWTVAELAAEARVSRAALARRFHDFVGEPPMAYLTGWRLALAADLLADPSLSVSQVSRQVGYTSPFTFSAGFKRAYGQSPMSYRRRGAR